MIQFYYFLNETMKINKRDFIVIGNMNAKVGAENKGREQITGRHGLGEVNETVDLLNFAPLKIQLQGGADKSLARPTSVGSHNSII